MIYLNSAIEWAVQRFLCAQLGPQIPPKCLEGLLKQSHDRLLNDWVLPLERSAGLNLESNEWPSIKKVQQYRREAGHPSVSTGLSKITDLEFAKLMRDATTAMAKLAGLPVPKAPPPMVGDLGGETVKP